MFNLLWTVILFWTCCIKTEMVTTHFCKRWHEVKQIVVYVSYGKFEPWLSRFVFAGGGSHRERSETANTGHVSFLQQAQEQVLLPLGSGHYLKEKNKSPSQYQPGLWDFNVIFKFQSRKKKRFLFTFLLEHLSSTALLELWPRHLFFCPSRSLLMAKSRWKSLQMAYMLTLPRNTQ